MSGGFHGVDGRSSVGGVAGLADSSSGQSNGRGHRRILARMAGGVSAVRSPSQRAADLSRLGLLWPWEVDADDLAGRRSVISRLERICRNERTRGTTGHWTYDLARHEAIYRALKVERAELATLKREAA